jgi:hypothetical protein
MVAFPLGIGLVTLEMQLPGLARAVPIVVGVVVLIAGALQFTAWKALHLARCRDAPGRGRTLPADAGTAWRHGLYLGLHCSQFSNRIRLSPSSLRSQGVRQSASSARRLRRAPQGPQWSK